VCRRQSRVVLAQGTAGGAKCATCHRLEGLGGGVGPDVSKIWETTPLDKVVESILEPSREIKEGFDAWRIKTVDDRVLTGLIASQTAGEVVLREASGKEVRLPVEEIAERFKDKVSLMPVGSAANLSLEQFADLPAFLADRSAQESLRGTPEFVTQFQVLGPFSARFQVPDHVDTAREYAGRDGPVRWKPATAALDGRLDLSGLIGGRPAIVQVATWLHAPAARTVQLRTGSGGPLTASVNGQAVISRPAGAKAGPDLDSATVELKAGANPVLLQLRFDRGQDPFIWVRIDPAAGVRASAGP
jgi:putative heme-binding domain-containing protein